ncbi:MAG: tRNA pseudouridine(38-40) synthase TruA [Bacteroidales bacterium]|nr:tRNA pseudouridine(38-40) synthase TruA [Bacteroidales bacterium]
MRYRINLSYNGTNYHGWQLQPNAVTVQEVLNNSLSMLLKENIETLGAGRTDTGVHASYFTAHFDCVTEISDTEKFVFKLNRFLPKDIAVFDIEKVSEDFNARFSAKSRTYKYYIHQKKDVFLNGSSWFYPYKLDVELMNSGCEILKQTTDFESFCKAGADNKTTICDLKEAFFVRDGHKIIFTVKADRFLRNMVRALVGTLTELGTLKMTIKDFAGVITAKNRSKAGQSVPACGLYLVDIEY